MTNIKFISIIIISLSIVTFIILQSISEARMLVDQIKVGDTLEEVNREGSIFANLLVSRSNNEIRIRTLRFDEIYQYKFHNGKCIEINQLICQ